MFKFLIVMVLEIIIESKANKNADTCDTGILLTNPNQM